MTDILTGIGDFLGLNKGKATQQAALDNKGIINDYGTQGGQIIDAGASGAEGYLRQILGLTGGTEGAGLYGDAIGVNGAEGGARAQAAFTESPGYQFQMDQGLQALDRRNAAEGRFSSGNADLDTLKYSQGLASGDWNSWLDRLTGNVDRASGALSGLAGLSTGTANARLGLAGDVAGGLTSANNMSASGKEAGQGWGIDLLGNIAGIAGSAFGLKPPGMPSSGGVTGGGAGALGGYGGF